jgi:glycosyltransferase involved in cell wall biosynthesis
MAASLSVIFPAFNDAPTIAGLVEVADHTARGLTDDYEIIVVNDASSDATQEVLEDAVLRQPRLRIVQHFTNRGYGGAVRSGFAAATKDLVFYTDGDAQYDPRELELLWPRMHEETHLVQGYKLARHDPLHRIVIGRAYRRMVRIAFGLRVRDVDCDFRLIRRSLLQSLDLRRDSGAFCVELIRKAQDAGFQIVEVPVHHHPRLHGRSQFFRLPHITRTLVDLADLWRETVLRRVISELAASRT